MTLIDELGRYIRQRCPLFVKLEQWVYGLPAFPSAVLTSLGHGLLTAASLIFAPVTASIYTVRELQQARVANQWPVDKTPLYDSVLDIVVPWLVVAFYSYLLGRILA